MAVAISAALEEPLMLPYRVNNRRPQQQQRSPQPDEQPILSPRRGSTRFEGLRVLPEDL
jgi:hypothetical protein